MIKNVNWNSIVDFARKAINQMGYTWDDIAAKYCGIVKPETIRQHVRKSYARKGDWDKLRKKEQANRVAKENAAELASRKETNEVILADTGFLMLEGIPWIMNQSHDIYVSDMTLKELEGLSRSHQVADDLLTFFWSTKRLSTVSLFGKENLAVEPYVEPRKPRIRNIVASSLYLVSRGKKVKLYTNSFHVSELAKQQNSPYLEVVFQGGEVK